MSSVSEWMSGLSAARVQISGSRWVDARTGVPYRGTTDDLLR